MMRAEGATTGQAVITGIGRTGRLVTSAALILFLAMGALASAPVAFLKVFATGVGAGILLDATVVRSLLVPALVSESWDRMIGHPGIAKRIRRLEEAAGYQQQPVSPGGAGGEHPALVSPNSSADNRYGPSS